MATNEKSGTRESPLTRGQALQFQVDNGRLPMRADEDGGVEESATVAAYDWLDGWGGTSSSSESSSCSAESSPLSNNLEF